MKVRILAGLLVISTMINVAGLVFFLCFLKARGQIKAVNRERNQMANNLSAIRGSIISNGALKSSDHIFRRSFISHLDGTEDYFAITPPNPTADSKSFILVVYLHGMGSNYLEPFVVPASEPIADAITSKNPNIVFLSLSYRQKASWGNDAAIADINQNIREVCQEFPIKKIVIMGTSMGGCTALSYAAQAPPDIKERIAGVVSAESAGDLLRLCKVSENPSLKEAMTYAFGGEPEVIPEIYRKKSFLPNISSFPRDAKVAIISAREDVIIPPELQKEVVQALQARQIPVELTEVGGGHGALPADMYVKGLDFTLGNPVSRTP